VVQSGVDFAVGGVYGVEGTRWGVGGQLTDQGGEWTEQTHAQLDQEDAKFQFERRLAVASGLGDTSEQAFGAQVVRS
jgi:hypothetical protein